MDVLLSAYPRVAMGRAIRAICVVDRKNIVVL